MGVLNPHSERASWSARFDARQFAFRLATIYAVLAGTWIFVSDRVAAFLLPQATWSQTAKGLGFVLLTAAMLYGFVRRELGRRDAVERVLRAAAAGVTAQVGEDYFWSLARYLQNILDIDCVIIGRLVGSDDVETVSVYSRDGPGDPMIYHLDGTPCAHTINNEYCVYQSGVAELFPDDVMLKEMGAEGYVGIRLLDSQGKVMGLVIALSCHALYQDDLELSFLKVFAARISAELERRRYEQELLKTIQDLQRAEERAQDACREAKRANQAKSQFLAAASHDLRQPLQGQRLFLDLLSSTLSTSKQRGLVQNLDDCLASSERLLNALLDIGSLETGKVKPVTGRLVLADLIDPLAVEFAAEARAKGLDFRVFPCHRERWRDVTVETDRVLLERVLRNLLSNAMRHTAHGKVLLACRLRPTFVSIEVWDTGSGIPDDQQRAIFEDFHQLGNPERDRRKGIGLGLSIVARLARLLGHDIGLRSRIDRGSVFFVQVARAAVEASPAGERSVVAPDPTPLPRETLVLVIEDDPNQLMALSLIMEVWGMRIATAVSAEEARDKAKAARPDIIISDYRLPGGVSGTGLVTAIRQDCGTIIPAILVTGDVQPSVTATAASLDIAVLHKPYQPDRLLSAITQELERHFQCQTLSAPR